MLPQPWLYGVAAISGLLYLAVLLYTRRLVRRRRRSRPGATDNTERADGSDAVVCPSCDTENDPGYRYCRSCVSTLPGEADRPRRPRAPITRGLP